MPSETGLLLELRCFRTGATVRSYGDDGAVTEFPVDPEEVTKALIDSKFEPERFTTGLVQPDLLWYSKKGTSRIIVQYRPPMMTGFWIEGSEEPVKCPLPGIVWIAYQNGQSTTYRIYAVKERPTALNDVLYEMPLPNVDFGGMCWGSTRMPETSDTSMDFTPALTAFFSTPFGNHTVSGKSRRAKYKSDIRALLFDLARRQVKKYPVSDLVKVTTLKQVLEGHWR